MMLIISQAFSTLAEGQAVSCSAGGTDGYMYRYTSGQLRHYPNPTIAYSWDSNWVSTAISIDCTGMSFGPDMLYTPLPAEGQATSCSNLVQNDVYRYTGGELRHYPDATVAFSWDLGWQNFITIDCTGITIGPDMELYSATTVGYSSTKTIASNLTKSSSISPSSIAESMMTTSSSSPPISSNINLFSSGDSQPKANILHLVAYLWTFW